MGANAQTSVPAFTAGQVLTAEQQTQINTGIPVFATSTTRDAAFGGTGEKVLAEGQFAYLEDSNTTQYYDGSTWVAIGAGFQYAFFREEQASGTNGGTFTAGSYVKRVLNTTVVNTIVGCSLSSSVVTLPAGTYCFLGRAPGTRNNLQKTRLANTTDSTYSIGSNSFIQSDADYGQVDSWVQTQLTITGTKTFELQHRCAVTQATNGLGRACSFGDVEVYAQLEIWKVA